jgi:hypothetical protein
MVRVLWLSVIPGLSSRCWPGPADLNFERVVLVGTVTGFTVKDEHVKSIRVRNAGRNLARHIASFVDFAHSTSANERQDLIRPQPGFGCQRHWNPLIVPFGIWIPGGLRATLT